MRYIRQEAKKKSLTHPGPIDEEQLDLKCDQTREKRGDELGAENVCLAMKSLVIDYSAHICVCSRFCSLPMSDTNKT